MSDTSRPKRSKKRTESGLHGKHYERKIFTLIALKSFLDEDIKDFWLLSNPNEVEKFDDVILFTEHKSGQKNLFMIQVKHKLQGENRPIIANKLDSKDKNLSLEMYQEAFLELEINKDFHDIISIPSETKTFLILFNNCKVNQEVENENINFKSECHNFYKFINTSSDQNSILRIVNKCGKYDQKFLDRFYFYTEQLNEDLMDNAICNLLGIGSDTNQIIRNFFYAYVDDHCSKLRKRDLEMLWLDIFLEDFQLPPFLEPKLSTQSTIMNIINKFDITVIHENKSLTVIWNEILQKIQNFCDDDTDTKSVTWDQDVSNKTKKKLSLYTDIETFLSYTKNVTFKSVYMFLVTQRKIPFLIKSTNKLFDCFKNKLLHSLNIYSVVVNVHNEDLSFLNVKNVFKDVSDVNEDLYSSCPKKLKISFQGKSEVDLYKLIKNNCERKQKMSVDNCIELFEKRCLIGSINELPEYYINRQINIPVLTEEVFDDTKSLFFVFGYPKNERISKLKIIDFNMYLFRCYLNIYEEPKCIITIKDNEFEFNDLITLVESVAEGRTYYFLKYIKTGNFLLMHTNGSLEKVRAHIKHISREDLDLTHIYKDCKINIICNNPGMGKSILLNFISTKLSPNDWVIHMDLKKYCDTIKNIKTVEELINFSYNCQNSNVSESCGSFLKTLYKNLKHRTIWLIDDYEEINNPALLELFKLAQQQGFKIWIVVRPFLKVEFEKCFGVFSMELVEFSTEDHTMFVSKYLKQKNKHEDDIKDVMKAMEKPRRLLENSFIGIPQQTMMLIEIFLENSWKECDYLIHDIYEQFLKLKINDNYGVEKDWYIRTISKLALKVFFTDSALKEVFDLEELTQDVRIFKNKYPKDFFIIEFGENDVPIFSHKTYAEFLAARWLFHTVEKQINLTTPFNVSKILRMLFMRELTSVRLFLDNMLTKKLPLHSAIVNKDKSNIKKLIENPQHLSETDLLGRTAFHLVLSYGKYFEVGCTLKAKDLIRNLDLHSEIIRDDKNILLNYEELLEVNDLNADVFVTYFLPQIFQNFLDFKKDILENGTFLALSFTDYALLSGSLIELNKLISLRNMVTNSPLVLSEDMKYFLIFHSVQNKFNSILDILDVGGLNNIKIGPSKMSLLHWAVKSKNLFAVRKLTKRHNLDDWGVDSDGNTPLHIACNQKNNDLLEYFIEVTEIDVNFLNKKNKNDQSHLHYLACRGHNKSIKKIIKKFPNINIDSQCCNGNTPFLMSIIYNNLSVAVTLQRGGAKVSHCNNKNMTALHYAASKGFGKCVKKLLEWNVDVNQKDNYKITPLMKASTWGHEDIVKLLLRNKAKVNLGDNNKSTALHYAVRRNNIEIVKLLLASNASVNCVNKNRESPLIIACKYNFPKIVKLLLSCDVTYGKKRALKLSFKKGHTKCMDLLLQEKII